MQCEEKDIPAFGLMGMLMHKMMNRAQEMYYAFLHTVATTSCCRHVIVTAGNHDSPSFLEAPRAVNL